MADDPDIIGKRQSTTTKTNPQADQTNWRTKLQKGRIKFDDEQKKIFLAAFAENGLKGRSASAAGVTLQTVSNHQENDPDFAESYDEAVVAYRDKFVDHATNLAYNGIEVKKFNKDGDVIEKRTDYPIRLIELELKRVEPAYREKQTIDLNHTGGGVLVAPGEISVEQAIAEGEKANEEATKAREAEEKENGG